MFGFDQIRLSTAANPAYVLDRVGLTTTNDIAKFFDIAGPCNPLDELPVEPPLLETVAEVAVNLNAATVSLDDCWSAHEFAGSVSYWLGGRKTRDSFVMVEVIDFAALDRSVVETIDDFARIMITSDRATPDTIVVGPAQPGFTVFYELPDDTNVRNVAVRRYIEQQGTWYLLNFSSFTDIDYANPDYYGKLLGSIFIPPAM
jgi:hypothetical protein